jgi:hypothetical protein
MFIIKKENYMYVDVDVYAYPTTEEGMKVSLGEEKSCCFIYYYPPKFYFIFFFFFVHFVRVL